jgi:hypothetical protein
MWATAQPTPWPRPMTSGRDAHQRGRVRPEGRRRIPRKIPMGRATLVWRCPSAPCPTIPSQSIRLSAYPLQCNSLRLLLSSHVMAFGSNRLQFWNGDCQQWEETLILAPVELPMAIAEEMVNSRGRGMDRFISQNKRRCPFTQDPFEECYVVRLRSEDVCNVICYCGGDFEECEIYQKHLSAARREEDVVNLGRQHAGKR